MVPQLLLQQSNVVLVILNGLLWLLAGQLRHLHMHGALAGVRLPHHIHGHLQGLCNIHISAQARRGAARSLQHASDGYAHLQPRVHPGGGGDTPMIAAATPCLSWLTVS